MRAGTKRPININFFCHPSPQEDAERQAAWRRGLAPYYVEAGLDPDTELGVDGRAPFDETACAIVEEYRPAVVSFHFGLPEVELFERVKRTGARVISSATTVSEAIWLEEHGADAVIAMGAEAGGHRASFLTNDMATQIGTFALLPQFLDSICVPVIAAGGIVDARGSAAAAALGACAVQAGTAYLLTPEAKISGAYRKALDSPERGTAITNLFTGRPARGIVNRLMLDMGALSDVPPAFPTAGAALAPLRKIAEVAGRDDFSPLWAGQSYPLAKPMSAAALTRELARPFALSSEG